MHKRFLKTGICLTVIFLFVGSSFFASAFTTINKRSTTINKESMDSCDIPTWCVGDEWIYTADPVTYNSVNGSFDGKIENLKREVVDITTITHDDEQVLVYKLESTGDISGQLTWGPLSGDLNGIIEGTSYVRVSDLAEVETEINSTGIVQILFINRNYEMINSNSFIPPIELYDFPLKVSDQWELSYTDYSSSSFKIEGLVDEENSESNLVNEMAYCNKTEIVSVPAGDFDCFNISVSSDTYLYSPEVGNIVKSYVGGSGDNTLTMDLTLESFSKASQKIDVTENIDPSEAIIDQDVIISGQAVDSNSNPIQNGDIYVEIPRVGESWSTNTDENGNYSITIKAPYINDDTPSEGEFGSDGVIVRCTSDNLEGFTVKTLLILANYPPSAPSINGPNSGKIGTDYTYTFVSTDPDGDNVAVYIVNWGDGNQENITGPFPSGESVTKRHIWPSKGTYTIKAKAKDICGLESDWATFRVTMPRSYNRPLLKLFLERFPNTLQILRYLMGL